MPRSFLITKLHKWKDDDVRSPTGEINDDRQLRQDERLSTDPHGFTAGIEKSEDKFLESFIDETGDKSLSTSPVREVDCASPSEAVTSPQKQMTSLAENHDVMTSARDYAMASLPVHRDKVAKSQRLSSRAEVFPPPIPDLRVTSNVASFPFPVHSLPPTAIAVGLRRAVINSLPLPPNDKDILNAAALSIVTQQPRFNCLPWQPPLCCLLQPEVARLWRDNIQFPVLGGAPRLQRPSAVTSRRASPVNWLLSDDVKATSSKSLPDRKWNSSVAQCPTSSTVSERPADSDGGYESLVRVSGAAGRPCSERKLTCRHCAKPYASLGALKMHIRTHTLPCRCQLCGKAFSRPWLLQGHLRTHTGERPFACPQCGRAFADRSNLRAHLQTHAELKKYACDRCTKTFSRLSLLVKHRSGPGVCGTLASSSPWRPP